MIEVASKERGYSSTKPTADGWYHVTFEPGYGSKVYLWVSEYGISWGYDQEDDSEMINSEEIESMLFKKAETI